MLKRVCLLLTRIRWSNDVDTARPILFGPQSKLDIG